MTTESPEDKNRPLGVAPGSQAGDEPSTYPEFSKFLQDCHDGVAAIYTDKEKAQTLYNQQAADIYAERLATERATAELERHLLLTGLSAYSRKVLHDRIAELRATLTGKAES